VEWLGPEDENATELESAALLSRRRGHGRRGGDDYDSGCDEECGAVKPKICVQHGPLISG